ncbi:conserved hypothetical protein [Candidatus Magnetomoraceae bacterium gMMP-15]
MINEIPIKTEALEPLAPFKTREHAYNLWRENGQNIAHSVRQLRREGYSLSGSILGRWRELYNWEERAARAEVEQQKRESEVALETLLEDLVSQKLRYKEYLDSLPVKKIDNQAIYAYNAIIEKLTKIQCEIEKSRKFDNIDYPKLFLEFMEIQGKVLREHNPEGLQVLAASYDQIIEKFKEQYA